MTARAGRAKRGPATRPPPTGLFADAPEPQELLIVGYGNELRGDDGVGPWVAREAAAWGHDHLHVEVCHQLTPELAATMAEFDAVVFIDAADGLEQAAPIRLGEVVPEQVWPGSVHAGSPGALLTLAAQLYDARPRCWAIAIPVTSFEFGSELSQAAVSGGHAALELLYNLSLFLRSMSCTK